MSGAYSCWGFVLLAFCGITFIEGRALPPSVVPEPWYGDFIGSLPDTQGIGIKGDVYVVNDSCIQVLNFSYGAQAPDLFFWLDKAPDSTSSGLKLATFEFGSHALKNYDNARVVLSFPDLKVKDYKSFGLYCHAYSKSFGSVRIRDELTPPKAQFLDGVIVATDNGERYNVMSGPVLIMDRRTVKVYGFHFNGARAPDGFFFVGPGLKPNRKSDGVKVGIREKDTNFITSMTEVYTGNGDLILELPESHDIYQIDWISVYCYKFGVDFGHIRVNNVSSRIPPYVPVQKRYDQADSPQYEPWPAVYLLGNEQRTNFTFQLGPPGGERGYEAIAAAKPHDYVWYVNGYLIPELWLQRGRTYTFIVEGGDKETEPNFHNPLYISDEPFGGYKILQDSDKKLVEVYAGLENGVPIEDSVGRLCVWSPTIDGEDPNDFTDIQSYRKSLDLRCQEGKPGLFQWTPNKDTPDTVFYQSYTSFRMGWKIFVTDELPSDLPDFKEEPYRTNIWSESNEVTEVAGEKQSHTQSNSVTSLSCSLRTILVTASLSLIFSILR